MDLTQAINALSTLASAGAVAYIAEFLRNVRRPQDKTREQRLRRVAMTLQEASDLLASIQRDIDERRALAEGLQREVEASRFLAPLRQRETQALSELLRDALRQQSRRSLWRHAAVNLIFFLLGIAVTALAKFFIA